MRMGKATFTYEETGYFLRVRLKGDIDHHSAVSVRSGIDTLLYRVRPRRLYLDLSGVDFMDSSGLGLIMGRYALMQKLGGKLSVKNPNERIVRIFELAGLDKIVSIEREKGADRPTPHIANKKRKKQRREKK